jgi:hypothetical protein
MMRQPIFKFKPIPILINFFSYKIERASAMSLDLTYFPAIGRKANGQYVYISSRHDLPGKLGRRSNRLIMILLRD